MAVTQTVAKLNFQLSSPLLHAVRPCQGIKSAVTSFPRRLSKAASIRQCSQEARSAQVLRSELWGAKLPKPVGHARRRAPGCSMSLSTETAVSDELFADYKVSTAFLFPGQVGYNAKVLPFYDAAGLLRKLMPGLTHSGFKSYDWPMYSGVSVLFFFGPFYLGAILSL